MGEIIRRRRRRQSDSVDTNIDREISTGFKLSNNNSDDNADDSSNDVSLSEPQPQFNSVRPSSANNNDCVNSIRTDLLEDAYHSELADSDYFDDTHNWGDESQLVSNEYWHFLGRYE